MQTIKGRCLFVARILIFALVAVGAIGNSWATSENTDVSDIWWSPAEGGWGMQLVNTGSFVFATVFIYGTDGKPTWITGELGKTGAEPDTFAGAAYVNAGSYFGGPWNPAAATYRQVGTMTFVLNSVNAGQLTYSVDGVVVNKSVQRQLLTHDDYAGDYKAYLTETATGCSTPPSSVSVTLPVEMHIVQNGTVMSQVWKIDGETVTFTGAYAQVGRMGRFDSTWTSSLGGSGTMSMFQMTNEPYMFMARFSLQNNVPGCQQIGELVGVIPR